MENNDQGESSSQSVESKNVYESMRSKAKKTYEEVWASWPADEYIYKTDVLEKVAKKLGISTSQVRKLLTKPGEKTDVIDNPRKLKKVDEFSKTIIRKKIHHLYHENELPTFQRVLDLVNEDPDVPSFTESTFKLLCKRLNFECLSNATHKDVLFEKDEILKWRRRYLTKIKQFRQEKRPIYYTDETWIQTGHASSSKTVKGDESLKAKRIVVIHIGNEKGFVEGAGKKIKSTKSKNISEESIKPKTYEDWLKSTLPKLEKNAVVVMDSASYHRRLADKIPYGEKWSKSKIQKWLRSHRITFKSTETIPQLVLKVRDIKEKFYVVNKIAKGYGVEILRIPPYHNDLNAMDLVWSYVIDYIDRNKKVFTVDEAWKLIDEGIRQVTPEKWSRCIEQVIKEENEFYSVLDDVSDVQTDNFEVISIDDSNSDTLSIISDDDDWKEGSDTGYQPIVSNDSSFDHLYL